MNNKPLITRRTEVSQSSRFQYQKSKRMDVHEFDKTVSMIFRPNKAIKFQQTNINKIENKDDSTKNQQKSNSRLSSSIEKSFSLLKRFKDFIVPQSFNFLKPKQNLEKKQENNEGTNKNKSLTLNIPKRQSVDSQIFQRDSVYDVSSKQKITIQFGHSPSLYRVQSSNEQMMSPLQLERKNDEDQFIPRIKTQIISRPRPMTQRLPLQKKQSNNLNINNVPKQSHLRASKISQKQQTKSHRSNKSQQKSVISNNAVSNILQYDHIKGKKLKYFFLLSQYNQHNSTGIYILVGNQNQVDCILLYRLANDTMIYTQLLWSLNIQKNYRSKTNGSITNVALDAQKSCYMLLECNDMKIIEFYKYNPKEIDKKPTKVCEMSFDNQIGKLFLIKQAQVIIFYKNKLVEIYQITYQYKIKKKYQKLMETKIEMKKNCGKQSKKNTSSSSLSKQSSKTTNQCFQQLQIMSIGEPSMGLITIYLACNKSQTQRKQLFDLYIIQINFVQSQIIMTKPHKVYSILEKYKPIIKFQNYSQKFFLLNIGRQILAVLKQGYMIDSASVNIKQTKSILKYVGKNRLLLVTESKIQEYHFSINQKNVPYRIEIRSLDSIVLPENFNSSIYQFFNVLPVFNVNTSQKSIYSSSAVHQIGSNYVVCFQTAPSSNNKLSNAEIPYILSLTSSVSIDTKLKKLFNFQNRQIQKIDIKQIEQRVDIAKKMGLKIKDIYLQLWNRTKKKSVQDYCFLLDTLDYEIISKEIQKKLKKQSMLYTELFKIQSSCYYLMKKQVKSAQCTQLDLKNFIVSHFKLKKYQYFKDVMKFCKDEHQLQEFLQNSKNQTLQDRKLMFDIQAFYTYNQLQIKSYLLQLFHKYFFQIYNGATTKPKKSGKQMPLPTTSAIYQNKKKHYLLKIKIFMNNFRFQLRMIYEEFLQELIKLLSKSQMIIELLKDFDEILPKTYENVFSDFQLQKQLEQEQASFKEMITKQYKDKNNKNDKTIEKSNQDNNTLKIKDLSGSQDYLQITRLKRSVSIITNGQLQLQGIWTQIPQSEFQNYLYLDNIQTIYNRKIIQTLSKDVWFIRNLYSQHDLILKTKVDIQQNNKKLKSNYIFYFFIAQVYCLIENESYRRRIVRLMQINYSKVLPKHLKGKIQLYYKLFLEMQKLYTQSQEVIKKQSTNSKYFNQSQQILRKQTANSTYFNDNKANNVSNIQASPSVASINNINTQKNINPSQKNIPKTQPVEFNSYNNVSKSLYQKFLPPKPVQNKTKLQSFQSFLQLDEVQLFNEYLKLQFILVGCIFNRIKPIYEQFQKEKQIFNQSVDKYFLSDISQISHLKCLLNRLNSQSRQFKQKNLQLFQVLLKSIMVKIRVGSHVQQKDYINVDELICYVRDVYIREEQSILKQANGLKGLMTNKTVNSPKRQSNFSIEPITKQQKYKKELQFESNKRIAVYFSILGCVKQNQQIFKKLNANISLYQIYCHYLNKSDVITQLLIQTFIKQHDLQQADDQTQFYQRIMDVFTDVDILLDQLSPTLQHSNKLINSIDSNSQSYDMQIDQDNRKGKLFYTLMTKIMLYEKFFEKGLIYSFLEDQRIVRTFNINQTEKQNYVIFLSKYIALFGKKKLWVTNLKYMECLIQILPQNNKLRKYHHAQNELIKAIQPNPQAKYKINGVQSQLQPAIYYPLTQDLEIISIYHIAQIFSLYPSQYLLTLNLQKICKLVNQMQQILLQQFVIQKLNQNQQEKKENQNFSIEIEQKDSQLGLFDKLQRQNSQRFFQGSQRSYQKMPSFTQNQISNNIMASCTTPLIDTPMGQNSTDAILVQLQTLIKQSAQPYNFFNDNQAQLIKSLKQIRQYHYQSSLNFNKNSNKSIKSRQSLFNPVNQPQSAFQFLNMNLKLNKYYTSLEEIYEIVIKRLINSQLVKECMDPLQKLLNMSHGQGHKSNQLYIVYPLLILNIISKQLVADNKFLLIKICSHLFKQPLELLKLIKKLIGKGNLSNSRYSFEQLKYMLVQEEKRVRIVKIQPIKSQQSISNSTIKNEQNQKDQKQKNIQKRKRLKKKLTIQIYDDEEIFSSNLLSVSEKTVNQIPLLQKRKSIKNSVNDHQYVMYLKRPFSYQNPILSKERINQITSEQKKFEFVQQIWKMFEQKYKNKQIFSKDFEFMLMNVMLFQEPYTIVKYLQTKLKGGYFRGKQSNLAMNQKKNTIKIAEKPGQKSEYKIGQIFQKIGQKTQKQAEKKTGQQNGQKKGTQSLQKIQIKDEQQQELIITHHNNYGFFNSISQFKFKPILVYFNQMIKQPLINSQRLLQFGKRILYILYSTIVQRSSIEYQIKQYYDIPLTELIPCDYFPQSSQIPELFVSKVKQSISTIAKKQKQMKKNNSINRNLPNSSESLKVSKDQNLQNKIKSPLNKLGDSKDTNKSKIEHKEKSFLDISDINIDEQSVQFQMMRNQSKISNLGVNGSHIVKTQQQFDPSKQRQLVNARGQKRFSAMLSNSNNSAITIKTKLSPKSSRSSSLHQHSLIQRKNDKNKRKSKFFASQKQKSSKFPNKHNKKQFKDFVTGKQSSQQDIQYEEESVIYEEDFHTQYFIDSNEPKKSPRINIQPPKLKRFQQFDLNNQQDPDKNNSKRQDKKINLKNSKENDLSYSPAVFKSLQNEQSKNLQKSKNYAVQKILQDTEIDQLRFTQQKIQEKNIKNKNQGEVQFEVEQLYTPQNFTRHGPLSRKNTKDSVKRKIDVKAPQKAQTIVEQQQSQANLNQSDSYKKDIIKIKGYDDEGNDQIVQLDLKQESSYNYKMKRQQAVKDSTKSHQTWPIQSINISREINQTKEAPKTQITKNHLSFIDKIPTVDKKIQGNEINVKNNSKNPLDKNIEIVKNAQISKNQNKNPYERKYNRKNDPIQNQDTPEQQSSTFGNIVKLARQLDQRKQESNRDKNINKKDLEKNQQKINPNIKKRLNTESPEGRNTGPVKKMQPSSQTNSNKIVSNSNKQIKNTQSPNTNSDKRIPNKVSQPIKTSPTLSKPANSNKKTQNQSQHLHLKIKNKLIHHKIQLFLLQEFQDIYDKLKDYWQTYQLVKNIDQNQVKSHQDITVDVNNFSTGFSNKKLNKFVSIEEQTNKNSGSNNLFKNKSQNVHRNQAKNNATLSVNNNKNGYGLMGRIIQNTQQQDIQMPGLRFAKTQSIQIGPNGAQKLPSPTKNFNNLSLKGTQRRRTGSLVESQTSSLQFTNSNASVLYKDNLQNDSDLLGQVLSKEGGRSSYHSKLITIMDFQQQDQLFTKQQMYNLIDDYIQKRLKSSQQLPQTQLMLQQIKDKLFYQICMNRLVQLYSNQNNIHLIAKIIDLTFKKKVFVTDYYYQVISKREVQELEVLVEKVNQKKDQRTVRYSMEIPVQSIENKSTIHIGGRTNNAIHSNNSLLSNKSNPLPNKLISPRSNSKSASKSPRHNHMLSSSGDLLQQSLEQKIQKLQFLLQKIPLNILQYRKKQLMLKLKPGKDLGRKVLLDILVKVFQKKKDKKLGEQIYARMKNIIDRDIK